MSVASDLLRGNTDMILLAQLVCGESYGYEINKRIQEFSGGQLELKEATLYGSFRRLENAGYISSYWGDETTGARRRYYAITREGKVAFSRYSVDWTIAKDLIDALIKPGLEETACEKN